MRTRFLSFLLLTGSVLVFVSVLGGSTPRTETTSLASSKILIPFSNRQYLQLEEEQLFVQFLSEEEGIQVKSLDTTCLEVIPTRESVASLNEEFTTGDASCPVLSLPVTDYLNWTLEPVQSTF